MKEQVHGIRVEIEQNGQNSNWDHEWDMKAPDCNPIIYELNTEQKDQRIMESKPALAYSEFKAYLSSIRLSK